MPIDPIVLDQSLTLDNLQFNDDNKADISFSNLLGIDLRANLFKEKSNLVIELDFQSSNLDLFLDNNRIGDEDCTWDLNPINGAPFANLFSNVDSLRLENIFYRSDICPILFRNAYVNRFYSLIGSDDNYLKFIDLPLVAGQSLNSTIKEFYLLYSQVFLRSKFLNKNVFANTELFTFEFCNIYGMDEDVFRTFKKIRKIQFAEGDFNGLLNNTKWLNSINSDLNVNLNNQAEILANQNRSVAVYIEGNGNWFNYSNEIFCQLKDFPHKSLVYFLIFDQNTEITCTCTVLWLIQYRYSLNVSLDIMNDIKSDSVHKCYSGDFNKNIKACNFQERISKCNVKNPLEIQIEEKDRKIVELTVISSVLGCSFFVLLLMFIYVSIKYKKTRQSIGENEYTISFKPMLDEK